LATTEFLPPRRLIRGETIQVAASVIVTAVLTPILTSYVYKRVQRQRALEAQAVATASPVPVLAPGDD
jgi:hypothetical protein